MKRTKYSRRNRDLAYMAWIRSLACICCGTRSYVEAAHVGPKAFGQKCPDRQTLPLCRTHHRIGRDSHHELGRKFWIFWNLGWALARGKRPHEREPCGGARSLPERRRAREGVAGIIITPDFSMPEAFAKPETGSLMRALSSSLLQTLVALALHEAAHAIAARYFGLAVRRIGWNWIGPYVVRERSQSARINAVVSLAGPAANFLLAIVFIHAAPEFAETNFWLGLINALPFVPASDGKRAWKALRGTL